MKVLQIHPEKRVILRDGDAILFQGTFAEAEAVVGKIPALPEGIDELRYEIDTDTLLAFNRKGQVDWAGKWPAKTIVKKAAALAEAGAAMKAKLEEDANPHNETPEQRRPSAEELAAEEQRQADITKIRELAAKSSSADVKFLAAFIDEYFLGGL